MRVIGEPNAPFRYSVTHPRRYQPLCGVWHVLLCCEHSSRLRKRLRPRAYLVKLHLSSQFHAPNGAALVLSIIAVTGIKLRTALCFTYVSAQHMLTSRQQEVASPKC